MSEEKKKDEVQEEVVSVEESTTIERCLTFNAGGLILYISTKYVIEIINNHTITTLPLMPPYIKGIINMRGQIIPIVDIRSRLGKMPVDYGDNNCIIVLEIDSISLGILVDSVSQVVDSELSKISPVPVNKQQELVNGMISLDANNVVLLLDCEQLVNEQMMM
mgnify:CR=1 FL=1